MSAAQARAGSIQKVFKDLTEENLGAAVRLAENFKAFPGTYARMQQAIEAVSGTRRQEQADLQTTTNLTQDLDTAMQDLQSTILAQAGGELGLEAANAAVEKAQRDLNDAVRDYGPFSREAADADLALRQAKLQQANAAVALQDEVEKLTKDYSGNNVAIDAEIAKLHEAEDKYGANRSAIDPLITQLEALKTHVDNVPPGHDIVFTIIADLPPETQAAIHDLDVLAGAGIIAPGGLASGGFAPPGWVGWVGEDGPELMAVGAAGATVVNSKTSRAIVDKASTTSGSEEHFHFHVDGIPTDADAMAREAHRRWRTEMYLMARA
jgi:hypothetical protein